MIFTGKLTEITSPKTGQGQKGEWASLDVEVTNDTENTQYPEVARFSMFKNGEYIDYVKKFADNFKIGDMVTVDFKFKVNKYTKDGEERKFYKNDAFKITKINDLPVNSEPVTAEDNDSGLPF